MAAVTVNSSNNSGSMKGNGGNHNPGGLGGNLGVVFIPPWTQRQRIGPKSDAGIIGIGVPFTTGIPSGEFVKSPLRSASVMVCPLVVEFFEVDVRSYDVKKNVLFLPL